MIILIGIITITTLASCGGYLMRQSDYKQELERICQTAFGLFDDLVGELKDSEQLTEKQEKDIDNYYLELGKFGNQGTSWHE